uniref:CUB domain-containing protein n=1 Tax=Magallana gigas TaxID=29159 RepID=A0A8W8LNP5_MAGGI
MLYCSARTSILLCIAALTTAHEDNETYIFPEDICVYDNITTSFGIDADNSLNLEYKGQQLPDDCSFLTIKGNYKGIHDKRVLCVEPLVFVDPNCAVSITFTMLSSQQLIYSCNSTKEFCSGEDRTLTVSVRAVPGHAASSFCLKVYNKLSQESEKNVVTYILVSIAVLALVCLIGLGIGRYRRNQQLKNSERDSLGDNNRQGFNGNRNTRPDTTDFMHVPSEEPPQYNDIVKNKYKA